VKAKDEDRDFGSDNDDNVYNHYHSTQKYTHYPLHLQWKMLVLNNIHKPYRNLATDVTVGGRVEAVGYRSTSTISAQYWLCYRVFKNKD
jgi:hypothetical protein